MDLAGHCHPVLRLGIVDRVAADDGESGDGASINVAIVGNPLLDGPTRAAIMFETTATSSAAGCCPHQWGSRTSAGRRPGGGARAVRHLLRRLGSM